MLLEKQAEALPELQPAPSLPGGPGTPVISSLQLLPPYDDTEDICPGHG